MSRELDARVAEIVLGDNVIGGWIVIDLGKRGQVRAGIPEYSTDHNAAFQALDMACEGRSNWIYEIDLISVNMMNSNPHLDVDFDIGFYSMGIPRPTAMCLAALRAKGDDDWVKAFQNTRDI